MLKLIRKLIKIVLATLGVFTFLVFIYMAWAWWEVHQLRAFCQELKPGMSVSLVPAIAEKYGFSFDPTQGITFDNTNDRFKSIPALSTLGEISCHIYHDSVYVKSAEIPEMANNAPNSDAR